jgi:alpha-N-arabinofuranosidase
MCGILCGSGMAQPSPVTIDAAKTGEAISPYIYGQFIEHLGRCIYGGIWAEMLEDRKFHFPVPAEGDIWRTTREQARVLAASPWKVIGSDGTVTMVTEGAYVGEHSPHIKVTGSRPVGIFQGELGVLKGKQYSGHVILAGDSGVGPVTVSLAWEGGRDTHVIDTVYNEFVTVPFMFTAGADSDNARLEITAVGKGTLKIGTVSIMPADNVDGFRRDTLELLKQLDAPVYRWPGGNFVSGYDWRDGIGPRDKRPTRTNPAWTGIETNDMGMDEFIHLCRLINTEPMIAVNTGFGDAYSAAAEVEYANGAATTDNGRWRAQNGYREPFAVKWWCVGNEMFGRWQLGYMQLNHYTLKHNQVEAKMREVDPGIFTVATGNVGDWSKGMLTRSADYMDALSEHFYKRDKANVAEHVQQIPDNIRSIAEAHREYRKTIPALQGKDIRIALDEWNYWYGPHPYGELGTRYFLKDALGIAAGLHEYFRNSDIYLMANYAQTVNVIGCIKTTKTHAEFAATGLPLMLYRREFGTIPVEVTHDKRPLDISAALTADKQAITIGVVNPTSEAMALSLNLKGANLSGTARTWVISGNDPQAYNVPGEPRKVTIDEADATHLKGTVTVKPMSITLYRAAL